MKNLHLKRQHGITLFVVLIAVLISSLIAAWAAKSSLLNQLVISNEADYQRTFSAAQTALQDAEKDIVSFYNLERNCNNGTSACRGDSSDQLQAFPLEEKDINIVIDHIYEKAKQTSNHNADATNDHDLACIQGICTKIVKTTNFWDNNNFLTYMKTNAAQVGSSSGNLDQELQDKAWYWIEILPYDSTSSRYNNLFEADKSQQKPVAINLSPNVIYRVTAMAQGLKPGTRVVLQSTVVYKNMDI